MTHADFRYGSGDLPKPAPLQLPLVLNYGTGYFCRYVFRQLWFIRSERIVLGEPTRRVSVDRAMGPPRGESHFIPPSALTVRIARFDRGQAQPPRRTEAFGQPRSGASSSSDRAGTATGQEAPDFSWGSPSYGASGEQDCRPQSWNVFLCSRIRASPVSTCSGRH